MSAPGGISPYGERDQELAAAAIAVAPLMRSGDALLREVAGAIATARAEGHAAALEPFEALFAGDPDTPCRTTWRREPGHSLAGSAVPLVECVEVPIDELREAFDEAERTLRGES